MNFENVIANLDNSFLAQLLTLDGKIDLTIGLICTLLAFGLSRFINFKYLLPVFNRHSHSRKNFLVYLAIRSSFPLLAIILFVVNYLRFLLMTSDKQSIVYPALMWLALWMLVIRIIVGLFLFLIPKGAMRYSLDSIFSLLLWLAFLLWWTDADLTIAHMMSAIKIKIGPIHFTLLAMFYAIVTALIILSVSLWLNKLIELKINQTKRFDSTFKHVVLRISKFLVFFIVILSVLPVLGIDLTSLSIFSGALGVGLGIGLQKFIGNIFSGIMILMDRSIKIGDRLIVGDHTGYVSKITARHIVLQSLDNSEILVPNEKFVFDTIINQSYTDTSLLIKLFVNVKYNSDLKLALRLLIEAADKHPALVPSQPPISGIDDFGEYAIKLVLVICIQDPRSLVQSKTDIYLKIVDSFMLHNIEIPLPKQDLHIIKTTNT